MTGLDPALFRPDAISAETAAFNQKMRESLQGVPKWWELDVETARTAGAGPAE